MFEWIYDPQAWIALVTLVGLEIVLGIDNIIFIAILAGRLPQEKRDKARIIGLALAMITRIMLLFSIVWVMSLTKTLFVIFDNELTGRDLILLGGGLFLIAKSTLEIHHAVDEADNAHEEPKATQSFGWVLVQIALLDIIFSLDSVITAVGMASQFLMVMIIAVIISVGVMMFASKAISDFVQKHPTLKMLALSFLILIGVTLIGEGLGFHVPKGYIYFAMSFSLVVESLNIFIRTRTTKSQNKLKG